MTPPATMRALQQTSLNGPQDMRLITGAPVPSPGAGEVLIRVAAAGVNFADISKAHGTFLDGPRPPYLAGFEAAGEIIAVGEAVTGPQPGARVVGVGDGAFAEYMAVPGAGALAVPPGWAGGSGRAHLSPQPGRGQAGDRPCRRLWRGGRRSLDHQLGAGLQAPGPRDRLQRRRADPGCAADLRRGHG